MCLRLLKFFVLGEVDDTCSTTKLYYETLTHFNNARLKAFYGNALIRKILINWKMTGEMLETIEKEPVFLKAKE